MYSKDTAPSNGEQQSRRDEAEAETFKGQPQVVQSDFDVVSSISLVIIWQICMSLFLTYDWKFVLTG